MRRAPLQVPGLAPIWECLETETPRERMRGLLGRDGLPRGVAMSFAPCSLLHTIGMRFALDIVFLDRCGRVVRAFAGVRPGRLFVWGGLRAHRAVEAQAGWLLPQAARTDSNCEKTAIDTP